VERAGVRRSDRRIIRSCCENVSFPLRLSCCYVDVKPTTIRGLFFFYNLFTSRPKRDLLLCVARHRPSHYSECAPLKGTKPGISVSQGRTVRSFSLPVLLASSRSLGDVSSWVKGANEPFFSPHKVFVSSDHRNPHAESARTLQRWRPWTPPVCADDLGKPSGKFPKLASFSNRRPRGVNELAKPPSPVWVIGPRSVCLRWSAPWGPNPEILPVADIFQARANRRSSPEAGWPRSNQRRKTVIIYSLHWDSSGLSDKSGDLFSALKGLFLANSRLSSNDRA